MALFSMDFNTGLIIASLIILIFYWITSKTGRKLPPGPYGLPFVGYIPFMTSKPYLDLEKLAKRYGPVFRMRLGTQNVIVLGDYHSTKTAFAQDAFIGRPPTLPFSLTQDTLETGAFNGLPWKEQRRFSLHLLRDLGFGKSHMENLLKEEISDLLQMFDQLKGEPADVSPILTPSMSNNIATLVYGKRLKYDDPVRKMLDRTTAEGSAEAGQVVWEIFFPGLAKIVKFFGFSGASKLDKIQLEFKTYTRQQIAEHEKTLDESNVRDFIDGYLLEIRKQNKRAFSKHVLEDLVGAFFGAGSETVRLSVSWFLLTMAAYPDVQEKVYAEIENVIGPHRTPSYDDHTKMPYTEATIMELWRWRTIVPINILRYTLWDTELDGYFIPKSCYVISNLWGIHHNPEYWGDDAEEFRVERFLTEDGKEVQKSEYFIPFSIGKRQCPGETFAKIEVFLYFTSIIQKFRVCLPPGINPNFEGDLGIGLSPKPHKLSLIKRH